MKFFFLITAFCLLAAASSAQIIFSKGYYIDRNGIKTECLIKDVEWKNNPVEIVIRYSEEGEPEAKQLDNLSEFGIYGISKYISALVKVDVSPEATADLSLSEDPDWIEMRTFLRVLEEGKATLLYYEKGELKRYFYRLEGDTAIRQLVYKKYKDDYHLMYNNKFRQQLWMDVRCGSTRMEDMERLRYRESDLLKYFRQYNTCLSGTPVEVQKFKQRGGLNLKLSPTFNICNLTTWNSMYSDDDSKFLNKPGFQLGLVAEQILPFNKNKWALLLEPTFQSLSAWQLHNHILLKSLEFPVGGRYFIFLNPDLKIFVDAFYIPSYAFNFGSKLYIHGNRDLDIKSRSNYAVGIGTEYQKFSFEARYYTKRHILSGYVYWFSDYQRISFILGYKFLRAGKS